MPRKPGVKPARPVFFEPAAAWFQECVWRPPVDVKRLAHGWMVKAELAGVRAEQVQVSVRGNRLILSGVRTDTHCDVKGSWYAMEISYCRFERHIDLPTPLDGAEVAVTGEHGLLILEVRLPDAGGR
ncbi:MAG TPA: Hsp20/alpha crystallin family protein [Gemmatimonadota bacterium]